MGWDPECLNGESTINQKNIIEGHTDIDAVIRTRSLLELPVTVSLCRCGSRQPIYMTDGHETRTQQVQETDW